MNFNFQELQDREHLLRYLDNELSSEDSQEVESWLKRDQQARALLAGIAEQAILVADIARANTAIPKINQQSETKESKRSGRPLWLGIAAAFAISLGAGTWHWNSISKANNTAVARLELVSEDAEFSINHRLPRIAGSNLEKGWIQLEKGHVSIRFRSGASVELEGPASFGIDTPMRSYLDYGRVRVHAPESARDFVIATESMEVVDLGTKFELALDRETGESSVSVIEGLVDLHLGSRGTARKIRPMEAGYTAQVSATGEVVEMRQRSQKPVHKPTLLAHWKLEGTATDASRNKMDGEFHPAENGDEVPGIEGQALNLGKQGFIDLSEHAGQLARAEAFIFSAWVRDPSDRIAILFSLTDGTENERVQIHLNRRHLVYGWQNGLHFDSVSGRVDEWKPAQWYQIGVAVSDGMIWLYRDGQQIGSAAVGQKLGTPIPGFNGVKNPDKAFFGMLSDAADGERITPQWFGGAIDEVQIYTGALSRSDLQFLYNHPGKRLSDRL